ncbi:MAG: metallophosphoesterase [Proteobacteria bacterium]|nr:metallophosphoesterase [Pseudomonadota bacterium]NCU99676.1 metallophosphoesterase [Pseudomonadota bacterium]
MIGFLAVVLSVWGSLHGYAYVRLVRDPVLPPEVTFVVVVAMAAGAVSVLLAFSRALPPPWAGRVHWIAFTWLGSVFIIDVLLLLGDVMLLAIRLTGVTTAFNPLDLARGRATVTVVIGMTAIVTALRNGATPVPVRRVEVRPDAWPRPLDGLTIAVISDLHVAPGTSPAYVRDLVDRTNALNPDIIALCGDLVDGPVTALADAVRPLGDLRARLGTFAVTGNHEFFSDAPGWVAFLRQLGIDVLENDRRTIGAGDATFDVAGVPDYMAGRFGNDFAPRLADALVGRDDSHPVILLAHQPRQFDEAAALNVTLQVSGHTHGGQIWPFTILVRLVDHRVAGLYRQGRSLLYVSRGIRYWGPPMRLGAPHELSFLTLRTP